MILGFKTQVKGVPTGFVEKIEAGTKIHTIREDAGRRWKPGTMIQFATGVRTKRYAQFKSGKCISVQHIKIQHWSDGLFCGTNVFVDGNLLEYEQVDQLAINDGFSSRLAFFEWFSGNFNGYIIHWTDHQY